MRLVIPKDACYNAVILTGTHGADMTLQKIPNIFKNKERSLSFEFFPPKTDKGYQNLLTTLEGLTAFDPDFISCTYGAGGGNREKTFEIVELIQKEHQITGLAHLTCVLNTKEEILAILHDIQNRGILNVLALRGDPPLDNPGWTPGPDNFHYSYQLCRDIREHFKDTFGIGVAGFPEGHILCPDKKKDAEYLKMKIDNGADFVITQLFLDNQYYFDYLKRLRAIGVTARIIPGVLPITDYDKVERFCQNDGITIPEEFKKIFVPLRENKEKTLDEGIKFTTRQCRELLDGDAPGLHFYTLNRPHPVDEILRQIKK